MAIPREKTRPREEGWLWGGSDVREAEADEEALEAGMAVEGQVRLMDGQEREVWVVDGEPLLQPVEGAVRLAEREQRRSQGRRGHEHAGRHLFELGVGPKSTGTTVVPTALKTSAKAGLKAEGIASSSAWRAREHLS